jgi:hypothetical protein
MNYSRMKSRLDRWIADLSKRLHESGGVLDVIILMSRHGTGPVVCAQCNNVNFLGPEVVVVINAIAVVIGLLFIWRELYRLHHRDHIPSLRRLDLGRRTAFQEIPCLSSYLVHPHIGSI